MGRSRSSEEPTTTITTRGILCKEDRSISHLHPNFQSKKVPEQSYEQRRIDTHKTDSPGSDNSRTTPHLGHDPQMGQCDENVRLQTRQVRSNPTVVQVTNGAEQHCKASCVHLAGVEKEWWRDVPQRVSAKLDTNPLFCRKRSAIQFRPPVDNNRTLRREVLFFSSAAKFGLWIHSPLFVDRGGKANGELG